MAEFGAWVGEGKLLLETDDLIFRGAERLKIPLVRVSKAEAVDGWLEIVHADGRARFDMGDDATKWAASIQNPKTRIDKLDVKTTSKVAVVGLDDAEFDRELRSRTPTLASDRDAGLDLIFYRADEVSGLRLLASLRERIAPNGAIWIVTPKGRPEMGHEPIVNAAKAAGLIDTKTARFSETHTALKLVIPRAERAVQTSAGAAASNPRKRAPRRNE
ncbi:MAG: DUF3052 family protein [Longimicrobiales bacterium]